MLQKADAFLIYPWHAMALCLFHIVWRQRRSSYKMAIVLTNKCKLLFFHEAWMCSKIAAITTRDTKNKNGSKQNNSQENGRKKERGRARKYPKRNYLIIINLGIILLASAVDFDFEINKKRNTVLVSVGCWCGATAVESEPTIDSDDNLCPHRANRTLEWNTTE